MPTRRLVGVFELKVSAAVQIALYEGSDNRAVPYLCLLSTLSENFPWNEQVYNFEWEFCERGKLEQTVPTLRVQRTHCMNPCKLVVCLETMKLEKGTKLDSCQCDSANGINPPVTEDTNTDTEKRDQVCHRVDTCVNQKAHCRKLD